jgi:hypothetical protein
VSIKYFGEYLIYKNAINADQLAEVLIEQIEATPTVPKIVWEEKWLKGDDFLKIFKLQSETGLDFISAVQKLGLLSSDKISMLKSKISNFRIPVGQLLVNKSYIDLKQLTMLLDDYLSTLSAPQVDTTKADHIEVKHEINEVARPIETNTSSTNSSGSYTGEDEDLEYPEGMVAELEDLFDERKRRAIKVAMSLIQDKNQPEMPQ